MMEIRTENLTIVFVDIAGFTAVTSQQSRKQNAQLLESFNKALLPLIKRFKGRVIKSIGDALLVTFRSPTDAMLCGMALQDSIHEANLRVGDGERIHIRVAASLGEVRVTKNDIFGEPVNVASRIEGITPADEIYLSEAVYLAMNKAEVPAKEVGYRELSGINGSLRIYSIPRFAIPRLVPEQVPANESGSELVYPYGGMHFHLGSQASPSFGDKIAGMKLGSLRPGPMVFPLIAALGLGGVAAAGLIYGFTRTVEPNLVVVDATTPTAVPTLRPTIAPTEQPTVQPVAIIAATVTTAPATVVPTTPAVVTEGVIAVVVTAAATPVPPVIMPAKTDTASIPTVAPIIQTPIVITPKLPASPTRKPTARPPAVVWSVTSAKAAYRAGRLNKVQYKAIIVQLENQYENTIRSLKLAYKAGKITRDYYDLRVRAAKQAFRGD